MSTPFEKMAALETEIENLQDVMRSVAQEKLKPALKELVSVLKEQVPPVKAVRWNQYIPGFNDGATCEFTMGDLEVRYRNDKPDVGEQEDGFVNTSYVESDVGLSHTFKGDTTTRVEKGELTHQQAKLLVEADDALKRLSTATELAFGTDVEVTLDLDSGDLTLKEYISMY